MSFQIYYNLPILFYRCKMAGTTKGRVGHVRPGTIHFWVVWYGIVGNCKPSWAPNIYTFSRSLITNLIFISHYLITFSYHFITNLFFDYLSNNNEISRNFHIRFNQISLLYRVNQNQQYFLCDSHIF